MVKVIVSKINKLRNDLTDKLSDKFLTYSSIPAILLFMIFYFNEGDKVFDLTKITDLILFMAIIISVGSFVVIYFYVQKEAKNFNEYKLLKELEEQVATSGIDKN